MSYAFNPELAAAVGFLPKLDLTDVQGARDAMKQLYASCTPYGPPRTPPE